jgi:ParB/RepB/Spo0J family partition protein
MSKAETVQKNTKNDYIKVLLSNVVVEDGFNVREDLTGIDELAKSIAINGQVVPGIGFKIRGTEQYVITAGHRRFAAIKVANEKYGAKITHMNVMAGSSDEKERVTAMLLDGDASHSLTNAEMVKGISKLLELGVTKKEIIASLAIGDSQAQKYNLIKAAEAPKAIQKMLEEGQLSVAKVNAIQRQTTDENEQVELAEKASKEGRKPKEKKENPVIAVLEEALSLSDPTSAKVATLQAIVRKLKSKASAEDIAKLLK